MQQFQVPQFITVEDRIIGPLTLKQFFYLLGAGGIAIIGWTLLHPILFVLIIVPFSALFIAMAFLKINQQPLPKIIVNAINYYLKPRLYLWRHIEPKKKTPGGAPKPEAAPLLGDIPKLTGGKLGDLAWSLDVQERVNRG